MNLVKKVVIKLYIGDMDC